MDLENNPMRGDVGLAFIDEEPTAALHADDRPDTTAEAFSPANASGTILQVTNTHFYPLPDNEYESACIIFRRSFIAPVGRCGILVQIQRDLVTTEDAWFDVELVNLTTGRSEAKTSLSISTATLQMLDQIILDVRFYSNIPVEIICRTTMDPLKIRTRHVKVVRVSGDGPLSLQTFRNSDAVFRTGSLKAIFVGTTNICNANCPHCPTNKKMTAHLERGVMSMETYEKMIDGLDSVDISDSILFGLFGEPFEDPLLEERIKYTKKRRPDLSIDIATNGLLATPANVGRIINDIRRISIHVEAASPELYNKLMAPLKAHDVFPHIDQLIKRFGGKITVTTPLHQSNVHEVPALKKRWSHHGTDVNFLPLQTRGTDRTIAKRINIGATGGFWNTDILDILFLDWDGMVLATCDDFLRRQPLGNLQSQSIAEVMNGNPRRKMFDALRGYRWSDLPSFTDAIVDDPKITRTFSLAAAESSRWEIHGQQMLGGPDCTRTEIGIKFGGLPAPGGPLVYGPYLELPAGRYHASFIGTLSSSSGAPRLTFEVMANFGTFRYAAVERPGASLGEFNVGLEFIHDDVQKVVEFRILETQGCQLEATLERIVLTRIFG